MEDSYSLKCGREIREWGFEFTQIREFVIVSDDSKLLECEIVHNFSNSFECDRVHWFEFPQIREVGSSYTCSNGLNWCVSAQKFESSMVRNFFRIKPNII